MLDEKKIVSLERISWTKPVNEPDNWQSAASTAGFATPGFMNSQHRSLQMQTASFIIDPKVFFPDNSGLADFTQIQCQFEQAGNVGTIQIFDASGRKVKDLVQNATLSDQNVFKWDGTDSSGNRVNIGYYFVYIKVFNLDGAIQTFKKKVVVGSRF